METVSIKISKHTKYIVDRLAAEFNAHNDETSTNDDVLWRVLVERNPDLAEEAERILGKRIKPKRGKSKGSSE